MEFYDDASDFFGIFFPNFNKICELTEYLFSRKTAEEVAEFCKKEDLTPVNLIGIVNRAMELVKEDDPDFDPGKEFKGIDAYLAEHDFVYDAEAGIYREK